MKILERKSETFVRIFSREFPLKIKVRFEFKMIRFIHFRLFLGRLILENVGKYSEKFRKISLRLENSGKYLKMLKISGKYRKGWKKAVRAAIIGVRKRGVLRDAAKSKHIFLLLSTFAT